MSNPKPETEIVDLSDLCPQCSGPWDDHPIGPNGERECHDYGPRPRRRTGHAALRKPERPNRIGVVLALVLLAAMTASWIAPPATALGPSGIWSISAFSGKNLTVTFTYPGTVNLTIRPVNVTVSGTRSVTISASANASTVYLTQSIGFYPAGANYSKLAVNVSWTIPASLQNGGGVIVAVGISGSKTYETTLALTIQSNITQIINTVIGPIISAFQSQIGTLRQQLGDMQAAQADSDFRHLQIEALEGFAIAGLVGYIVYDRRKRVNRTQEETSDDRELTGLLWDMAVENAEPGDDVRKAPPERRPEPAAKPAAAASKPAPRPRPRPAPSGGPAEPAAKGAK